MASENNNSNKLILTNCCCGCSLRTGSLAIAIMSLIFSLIGVGYGIFLGINGLTEGWLDVGIDAANIIFVAILIHGIRTESRSLILSWVWGTIITVVLTVLLGILIILLTSSLTSAIILMVLAVIQSYFILVVRSYAISLETPVLPVST